MKAIGFVLSLVAVAFVTAFVILNLQDESPISANQNPQTNGVNTLAVIAPTKTPVLVVLPAYTAAPAPIKRPTITPLPTATSIQLDTKTIAYVQQLMLDMEELLGVQEQVGNLLATPLPNDPEWNRQIQTVVSQLQAIHNRQVPINPPPLFAYYHLLFIEATEFCSYLYLNFEPGRTPTLTDINIARATSLSCYDIFMETMEQMPELPPNSIPDPHMSNLNLAATPVPTTSGSILGATVSQDANLRSGPGTEYEIVGGIARGTIVVPVARNNTGDWLQLDNGAWIAAFLVIDAGDLPLIETNSQAAPTPLPLPLVPLQEQPTAELPVSQSTESSCDPNYSGACIPLVSYELNCPDVGVKDFYSVGSDPHRFDRDNDGLACES